MAFLRAINVGGHTVRMDRLRSIFAGIGLRNVETFIASGNVIFDSSKKGRSLERRIGIALADALGYEVSTFIRTADELAAIAEHRPFPRARAGEVFIGFLTREPSSEARQGIEELESDGNRFHLSGRELYWLCRTRFSESGISGAVLERRLGMTMTLRNTNTVERLTARLRRA